MIYGKESNDKQTTENSKVLHKSVHEMPNMWKTARSFKKVRNLQNLLQRARIQGRDSWSKEGKLVIGGYLL